ncbi:MAG: class I SAM-dependent methyltransferase [Chloroflexota bacterium]
MTETALAEFYRGEYRRVIQGQEAPTQKDTWAQIGRARHLLSFVETRIPKVRAHLDIGAALGELLMVFKQRYGCRSVGIEPSQAYRLEAQARGLRVVRNLTDLRPEADGPFDLITLAHVLEHLPDPIRYLRSLREGWLSPDGHLLVETPSLYGHPCLEMAHTVAFSPATLVAALQASGLEPEQTRSHGRPYSRLLRLFVTVLARPVGARPPRGIGRTSPSMILLRRRIGMMALRSARRLARLVLRKEQLAPWNK